MMQTFTFDDIVKPREIANSVDTKTNDEGNLKTKWEIEQASQINHTKLGVLIFK